MATYRTAWLAKITGRLTAHNEQTTLRSFYNAQPWMESGLCTRSGNPEAWFTDRRTPDDLALIRRICGVCPVRPACLDYALELQATDPSLSGVWAGTTNTQRRHLLTTKGNRK